MTQNPILKVLFTFQKSRVKSLLIGGQACIIYGAAEFSRDSDFVILCTAENLRKIKRALATLKARSIYVPPLAQRYLDKGHACHLRCYAEPVKGLRVDIIGRLRGCDPFEELWKRRHTVKLPGNRIIEVISLDDLVRSKKTQRDKDWSMLSRLVENDILLTRQPSCEKIEWWLLESRNANRLIELASKNKNLARKCISKRPLLKTAMKQDVKKLQRELHREEQSEREKDRSYWRPLRKELEMLRHKKRKK